jgi:2-oxoglutarate ferredoxin oxidoreductase subunit delta
MNKPGIVANLCKSCGYCVHFCPKQAIKIGNTRNMKGHYYPVVDEALCIGCGTCALVCPEAAIDILKGDD